MWPYYIFLDPGNVVTAGAGPRHTIDEQGVNAVWRERGSSVYLAGNVIAGDRRVVETSTEFLSSTCIVAEHGTLASVAEYKTGTFRF